MNDDSLIEIETKLAYLEMTQEELSTVLYQQQLTIEKLTLQLNYLTEKTQDNSSGETATFNLEAERPPHY